MFVIAILLTNEYKRRYYECVSVCKHVALGANELTIYSISYTSCRLRSRVPLILCRVVRGKYGRSVLSMLCRIRVKHLSKNIYPTITVGCQIKLRVPLTVAFSRFMSVA